MADATAPSGPTPDPSFGQIDQQILSQDAALAETQAQLSQATEQRNQYEQQRDVDNASFDPDSAAGAKPTFNEPTPQDHFNDVVKTAPLMMALGAVAGAFGKQHGITMLASTNAMMKGVVQGNADAYKEAREKYNQQYENFQDKSKTWLDVYKAYSVAYKGRLDADQKAVQAANASVGVYEKEARMTKGQIAQLIALRKSMEVKNAQIQRMSDQEVTDMIRAEVARQNAASNATRAHASETNAETNKEKTDKNKDIKDEDTKEVVSMIDQSIKDLTDHPNMMTGGGGRVRRAGEYVGSVINPDMDTPASRFADNQALLKTKITALMKSKGRMGADERKILQEGIDVIDHNMTSTKQGREKLLAVKKLLTGGYKNGASNTSVKTAKNLKTGETLYLVNGKWVKDAPQ